MQELSRYLDDLPQIAFWELDEFLSVYLAFGVGVVNGNLFTTLLIGVIISKVIAKAKESKIKGYFIHKLYWYGFFTMKGFPNPYVDTMFE